MQLCLALVVDFCTMRTRGKTSSIKTKFQNKLQKPWEYCGCGGSTLPWGIWLMYYRVTAHDGVGTIRTLTLTSSHREFTTEPNLCNHSVLDMSNSHSAYNVHACCFHVTNSFDSCTQQLFIHMSVNHWSMFCVSLREDGKRERGRQTEIARGDEEIKFHLTLKKLLYKTNYFSNESFHHCMAVGPRAITWLRAGDRLFVFIMWRAVMNAWNDLFFPLSPCLPLTQLICKYKVIVTQLWRWELK